jgi:hypothetical protein
MNVCVHGRRGMRTAATFCVLALALGLSACGGSKHDDPTTLRLQATETNITRIPQSSGSAAGGYRNDGGDALIVAGNIAGGGQLETYCVISERPHTDWCSVTVILPRGQLSAEGVFLDAPTLSGDIAVLGGSGRYIGASGTLSGRDLGARTESVTLRLR